MKPLVVVKVGGSLLSWPGLRSALLPFLSHREDCRWVLVPGGGTTTDIVRGWDHAHRLGEEASHWLALASMTLNAHLLATMVSDAPVVDQPAPDMNISIINPLAFCRRDDSNELRVPHSWSATSDAIAGRIAEAFGASEIVLLKSAAPPPGSFEEWAAAAYIDSVLPKIIRRSKIPVQAVNSLNLSANNSTTNRPNVAESP